MKQNYGSNKIKVPIMESNATPMRPKYTVKKGVDPVATNFPKARSLFAVVSFVSSSDIFNIFRAAL